MNIVNSIFNLKILFLILLHIFVNLPDSFSQGKHEKANAKYFFCELSQKEIQTIINDGLTFLEASQIRETIGIKQFEGEWPAYINLHKRIPFFKYERYYDSNAFSVIPIHNILAEIFLNYPEYDRIPGMLQKSIQHILKFKTDSSFTFGFWPYLSKVQTSEISNSGEKNFLVRKPNHFPLRTNFTKEFVNVVDDADDQALAIQAIYYFNKIAGIANFDKIDANLNHSVTDIFDNHRDINRKNIFIFDRYKSGLYNSGAYLTWFGPEYRFKSPNSFGYYCNNLFWFLPSSSLYTRSKRTHVPLLTNNVDVIVNLNIISSMAYLNLLDSLEGLNEALKMVNKIVFNNNYDNASLYYPNRYQLHYSLSKAYIACNKKFLNAEATTLISHLKSSQNTDGSWSGKKSVNKGDVVQSTANGLMALINFGDYEANNTLENINRAISFLYKQMKTDGNKKYWEGGIFYCGGIYLKNLLWWNSDCYTTAVIIHALVKYENMIFNK
ncbi:MAG: hypothetical protein ACM3PT_07065 [Deltaproteobacteria bacterium]